MVKRREGNISIIFITMFIVFTLAINSMLILERKTTSIKRQNIHSAVMVANLASYYAVEQGNKSIVLEFTPDELKEYLNNPDTLITKNVPLENAINMMTSEYFPEGERYKSVFINEQNAYEYFGNYLQENLGLRKDTGNSYSFIPLDDESNKGDIKELNVKSFEVYNAIYKDMTKINIPQNVLNEKRVYTGIHLDLNATINHSVKYGPIKDTVNVPIHIDTEITLFRPTIN